LLRKMRRKMCIYKCMLNVYKNQQNRQTGSRNLMGPKTLPTIWDTYMKLVTKYQISAVINCWEKCDEKCAYIFNVYKNQLSRQTGSMNLTVPKTLPTIWYTYMTLVTKYQISAINSCWEKCDEKYLGRKEGRTDGQTDRGITVYPLPESEQWWSTIQPTTTTKTNKQTNKQTKLPHCRNNSKNPIEHS
jgi:hypothetical protein